MHEKNMKARAFLARVLAIYRNFRKPVAILFGLLIAREALSLAGPYLYGTVVDQLIQGAPLRGILSVLGAVCAVAAVRIGLEHVSGRVEVAHLDFGVRRHVAETSMARVFQFSIGQHLSRHSGFKESVLRRGEDSLAALAHLFIYQFLPLALQVCFATVLLLALAPPIGGILALGVAAFAGTIIAMNRRVMKRLDRLEGLRHRLAHVRSEMLQQIGVIKMYAKEREELGDYSRRYHQIERYGKRVFRRLVQRNTLGEAVTYATEFLVMLVGALLVFRGRYTPGSLVVFLAFTGRSFGQLHAISRLHRQSVDQIASITRYFRMLDAEPEVQEVPNPVRPERFAGRIEFRCVSFSYPARNVRWDDDAEDAAERRPDREVALRDVSFTILPGQTVAIVGPSGAGKSTIVHLLVRAYDPDAGQVLVDGHDLRLLDLTRFRRSVGTVPQDVALFDGTLRRNIAFGLEAEPAWVPEERLREVAALSCVDRFLDRLEYGFDTLVGERGVRLSGGERQRVGIARALIKKPAILIFDEATSSLDTENERLIQESIRSISRGRTTIVIAHRLSTVKDADKILVMEEGRVVDEGTHEELVAGSPVYQRLIQNQTVVVG